MNIQLLLIIQIAVEVILCVAVVFLLIQGFGKGRKGETTPLLQKTDLAQLKALLDESRGEFQIFQEAMDRGRKTLGDMIRQIDDRETSLGLLLEEAGKKLDLENSRDFSGRVEENLRYKDAACLIRQGKTDREIARECGVTEGEVALIKGLLSAGNEPL
jgi:16S rRNA C1402 (ribose-2'-O) methylase RsmI